MKADAAIHSLPTAHGAPRSKPAYTRPRVVEKRSLERVALFSATANPSSGTFGGLGG